MSKKFDIYSKIFFRDVKNFFRHLCELVLRHQMRVLNYFVNSFYSVETGGGRGGGALAREVWHAAQLKKMGARNAQSHSTAKTY
jgi:hypothetical protein